MRQALRWTLTLAVLATALVFVGAAGATAPAYGTLQSAKDSLVSKQPSFPAGSNARQYLDQAVVILDASLAPQGWWAYGLRLNGDGLNALYAMRNATASLTWGDESVRGATGGEQASIVSAMKQVAYDRFNEVYHFIGEGGGPNPYAIWASNYYLSSADSEPTLLHASLDYISAWQTLLGQPPCC